MIGEVETNMKQMFYREKLDDQHGDEILDQGNYEGYDYIICSLDYRYPVAYVRIPEDSPFFKCEDKDLIDDYFVKYTDELPCHGGITFTDEYPYCLYNNHGMLKGTTDLQPGWYIGWDYSHCNDFHPFIWEDGKKWTTEEVLEEVHNVIKALNTTRVTKGE